MKRSWLSLLLVCALVLALAVPALGAYGDDLAPDKTYPQVFSDVPASHWAFKYIGELVDRKAINGYPDGKFYPENKVTRQEFAKIMVVAAGIELKKATAATFTDVPLTHWANSYIETAKDYLTGYVNFDGTYLFKPETPALREDIAVAAVRMKGYDTSLADLSMLTTMFSDVSSISAAARPYVALAVEHEIISGYTDGTFRGQDTIARSEAAAILYRAFQQGSANKLVASDAAAPSAALSPSAAPSPSPSASPSPSPAPSADPAPAPEAEKPYVAQTLAKGVEISDVEMMLTMDSSGNLIYYNEKDDQIVSLDPSRDRTTTLLNVGRATYTQRATTGTGVYAVTTDVATYQDLTVEQVFWDNVAGRLLVWGEFASVKGSESDGWVTAGKPDKGLKGIFTLEGGTLKYLMETNGYRESYYNVYPFKGIKCALSDGNYIMLYYSAGGVPRAAIYDTVEGEVSSLLDRAYQTRYIQSGMDIYKACGATVYQYSYGTSEWKETGRVDAQIVGYQNGVFYTWTTTGIQAVRPSDAATQFKLDPSKDVAVQDLRPLPSRPNNLFVTAGGQYLFYDDDANAIRVIRKNPKA